MVVDTPDTGGDLEWQERGKIDGFGDGIRDFSTGSRKSKVQPVWSYRRCVYSLSPEIKEGRAQTLYQKKGKGIFKRGEGDLQGHKCEGVYEHASYQLSEPLASSQ